MQVVLATGLGSPQTITVGGVLYTITFNTNPPALVTPGTLGAIVPYAIGQALCLSGQCYFLANDDGPPPQADQSDAGSGTSMGNIPNPYAPYVSPTYSPGDQF